MTGSAWTDSGAPEPGNRPRLVHHDGRTVPADQATLPVGSIALRYGVSVFEGVRLYRTEFGAVCPWLLDAHLDRLRHSCRLMGLDEAGCAAVPGIIDELVAANGIAGDSYVRIAASAGSAGGIGDPTNTVLTVTVTPSGRKRWLATGAGMRLTVSRWQRPSAEVFPSAAKNISAYAGPRLALAEAKAAGYDSCLLRTATGLISEAPTATVLLVEGARLVTPRLADAVLPSITRGWVLATAPGLGLAAAAEPVTAERLHAADEVLLCGTGLEFGPVAEIDGVPVPGWPGLPVSTRLVDEYFRQVRGVAEPVIPDWSPAEPAAAIAGDAG